MASPERELTTKESKKKKKNNKKKTKKREKKGPQDPPFMLALAFVGALLTASHVLYAFVHDHVAVELTLSFTTS
jgi:hypothetical protein